MSKPTTEEPRTSPAPRRSDLVPISNALLYLVFCFMAGTGLALEFRLESNDAIMLGVARRDWAKVHALTALSFLSLVVIHLWVNGSWLRGMLARARGNTLLVAMVGLAVLALLLLARAH